MHSLESALSAALAKAFKALELNENLATVTPSDRPELADFQCNGAFAAAKQLKKAPLEVAKAIVDQLDKGSIIASAEAVAPGFINLKVSATFLANWLSEAAKSPTLGYTPLTEKHLTFIDFGGPNVAKAMHVGHLRSTLIGDSLQRLARFVGDKVISDVHLGDWGTQMGMLIEEVKLNQPHLPYFDAANQGPFPAESPVSVDDLNALYPQASSRCKTNESAMEAARLATAELQAGRPGYRALWQHFVNVSIAALKQDFGALGVTFDLWKGESDANPIIPELIAKLEKTGIAQHSEGALVVPVAESETDTTPPLILVKSDGAVMYGTTDLATLYERVQEGAQTILYVVDKRQALHFKQVFTAAQKSGFLQKTAPEHIAFGTVNGTDGKPFKTRAGGVMRLADLIAMAKEAATAKFKPSEVLSEADIADTINKVALATIRFADLSNHRLTDYIFDLEKFSQFEGKTGPYLLYSAVRVKSLMRKAQQAKQQPGALLAPQTESERNLILALAKFPTAVENAYTRRAPNLLCDYAFATAQAFSRFYAECPILSEEDKTTQASRLQLAAVTLQYLSQTLALLGIELPEKM